MFRRSSAIIGLAVVAAFSAGTAIEATAGPSPIGEFTEVSKFLEANHLYNGIGDYLDASIITGGPQRYALWPRKSLAKCVFAAS